MRVIVADDAALFRAGLVGLLEARGVEVIAEVGDARDLLSLVDRLRPDAVITDIRMPPTHTTEGLEAALRIRAEFETVAVLVLSQYVEAHHSMTLLGDRPGHVGYLLKERVADVARLTEALDDITKGRSAIDPEVVSALLGRARERDPLATLSPRERDVLALMAEGRTNAGVCDILTLTPSTVETHVSAIFRKLDLRASPDDHRRVLAVLQYLRE